MGTLTRTIAPRTGILSATPSAGQVLVSIPDAQDALGAVTKTLTRTPAFAAPVAITSATYLDTQVAGGTAYTYAYRVTDSRGIASFPVSASATVPNSGTAATKILQSNGSGANVYTTPAAFVAALVPGDIGEIRADTVGGFKEFASRLNLTGKNGTSGNKITIRNRPGDTVRFEVSTSGTDSLLTMNSLSYVDVLASEPGAIQFGNPALFVHANYRTCYRHQRTADFSNSHHYTVRGCSFTGSRSWFAIYIPPSSTDYLLEDCSFAYHGTNCLDPITSQPGKYQDWGDMVVAYGNRGILQGCLFWKGGHNALTTNGNSITLRDCVCDGYWADLSGPVYVGARAADLDYAPVGSKPVVERCAFRNAARSADDATNAAHKLQSTGQIVRECVYLDNRCYLWHSGFVVADGTDDGPMMSRMYCYNNTSRSSRGVWFNSTFGYDAAVHQLAYSRNRFKLNIFGDLEDIERAMGGDTNYTFGYQTAALTDGGFPTSWRGTEVMDNIFFGPSPNKNFRLAGSLGATGTYPVDAPPASWSASVSGNRVVSLTFANAASFPNRGRADCAITNWSSVGEGTAPRLTSTVGSGSNSAALVLSDAGYFTDNASLAYFGESGDYIAIHNGVDWTIVQALSINHNTNVVTLTAPASWANGARVLWAGNPKLGAPEVRDNYGAVQ